MIEAVLFVAAPFAVGAFALRELLRRDARMASTLSGSLGLFAVVACALLVLAPIGGCSGPIQCWSGHDALTWCATLTRWAPTA